MNESNLYSPERSSTPLQALASLSAGVGCTPTLFPSGPRSWLMLIHMARDVTCIRGVILIAHPSYVGVARRYTHKTLEVCPRTVSYPVSYDSLSYPVSYHDPNVRDLSHGLTRTHV